MEIEINIDFENKVENTVKEILENFEPLTDGTDFRDFLYKELNMCDFLKDDKYKTFKNDLCVYLYQSILHKLLNDEKDKDMIKEIIEKVDN
jgi:predicted ATP-dependent endonuclease of OLD family